MAGPRLHLEIMYHKMLIVCEGSMQTNVRMDLNAQDQYVTDPKADFVKYRVAANPDPSSKPYISMTCRTAFGPRLIVPWRPVRDVDAAENDTHYARNSGAIRQMRCLHLPV